MCNETLLTMVICHVHSIMIISLLNEKSNTIVQNNSYFLEKYYRYDRSAQKFIPRHGVVDHGSKKLHEFFALCYP